MPFAPLHQIHLLCHLALLAIARGNFWRLREFDDDVRAARAPTPQAAAPRTRHSPSPQRSQHQRQAGTAAFNKPTRRILSIS